MEPLVSTFCLVWRISSGLWPLIYASKSTVSFCRPMMGHFLLVGLATPRFAGTLWVPSGFWLHVHSKDPSHSLVFAKHTKCFQVSPKVFIVNWSVMATLSQDQLALGTKGRIRDSFLAFIVCTAMYQTTPKLRNFNQYPFIVFHRSCESGIWAELIWEILLFLLR